MPAGRLSSSPDPCPLARREVEQLQEALTCSHREAEGQRTRAELLASRVEVLSAASATERQREAEQVRGWEWSCGGGFAFSHESMMGVKAASPLPNSLEPNPTLSSIIR